MKKIFAAIFCIVALCAFSKKPEPSRKNITAGMNAYLKERGSLCLAKNDWPIDVTQREMDAGVRNALQMPVLEKLGLVSSSIVEVTMKDEETHAEALVAVKRYQLTEEGRKYYLTKPIRSVASDGTVKTHEGDLCPVSLSLDKVIGWEPADGGEIVVSYTYRTQAAPWTRDPEVQKVFPAMASVVRGAGTAQLKERFEFNGKKWKAKDL